MAIVWPPEAVPGSAVKRAGRLAGLIVILGFMLIAILSVVTLFAFWALTIGLGDLLIRRFRKARDLIAHTASDLPLYSTIRTIS